MRLIDADELKPDHYEECETEVDEYVYRYYSEEQIDSAPTIKTKPVKYFDEDEKVWKIGSVIVE